MRYGYWLPVFGGWLRNVEDEGMDMVVMGTHGRSGLRRLVLGSVAEKTVRSAPVPVITVGNSA